MNLAFSKLSGFLQKNPGFSGRGCSCGLSRTAKILPVILALAVFFACVYMFSGFGSVFEYDTDEGMNLMRALLHNKGYALYKDIWMDSPPLLVLLLSWLFRIFGASVFIGRSLVLIFSGLLLWALFRIVYKTQNFISALASVVFLSISSHYLKLSVSVMAGLPSLSLAILSFYAVILYREKGKRSYLCLSGCLFALALQMKLFAIVFLPAIIYEIIVSGEENRKDAGICCSRRLHTILSWFIPLVLVYSYFSFVASGIDFSQMAGVYTPGMKLPGHRGYFHIATLIFPNLGIILLAVGALIFSNGRKNRLFYAPLISLVCAIFVFARHAPFWYHHELLIMVPLCWLASFGVYKLCDKGFWFKPGKIGMPYRIRNTIAVTFLSCAFLLALLRVPFNFAQAAREMNNPALSSEDCRYTVDLMKQYGGKTGFVVTDRPIFAFYSGLLVPPYLVTSSYKRFATGFLSPVDFVGSIEKIHPGLVLFARFPRLRDAVAPSLKAAYELEYKNRRDSIRLYISKDLAH